MTGSSLLPVAMHGKKLYFLFGKENLLEDSAKGFSDFGGGIEKGEARLETAFREGSEEMSGFLGNANQIKRAVKNKGGLLHLPFDNYHVHVFCMEYDEKLPKYFTNQHQFLWNRIPPKFLNKSKLFEKQEIRWFSVEELKTRRSEFRSFYRKIVDGLLEKLPEINSFCKKHSKRSTLRSRQVIRSNTRKMRGG